MKINALGMPLGTEEGREVSEGGMAVGRDRPLTLQATGTPAVPEVPALRGSHPFILQLMVLFLFF